MTRSEQHATAMVAQCIRLARDCSRNAWDKAISTQQRRIYRQIRREAMQDARDWQAVYRAAHQYSGA